MRIFPLASWGSFLLAASCPNFQSFLSVALFCFPCVVHAWHRNGPFYQNLITCELGIAEREIEFREYGGNSMLFSVVTAVIPAQRKKCHGGTGIEAKSWRD